MEYATLDYVDWFHHRRLPEELGMVPPAECEALQYADQQPLPLAASQYTESL